MKIPMNHTLCSLSMLLLCFAATIEGLNAFLAPTNSLESSKPQFVSLVALQNSYDDWRADTVVIDTMCLDEDNVKDCLQEFVDSEYGQTMFGCHERAASVGITGSIHFVELCGPQVTLSLQGAFWHRRSSCLGRAAMWLNARMPEITDVVVADSEELKDFEEEKDVFTGEVLFSIDKRSPDFNGDRQVMEYQGRDPDMRGPFPQGPMGPGGSLLNPI